MRHVLWALFIACGGPTGADDGPDDTDPGGTDQPPVDTPPDEDGPWAATTTAYDPACTDCDVLGDGYDNHLGDVRVLVDPAVDDAIAQWARCTFAVTACVDTEARAGRALSSCLTVDACPEACRDAATAAAQGTDGMDYAAMHGAITSVYFAPDGVCAALEEAP